MYSTIYVCLKANHKIPIFNFYFYFSFGSCSCFGPYPSISISIFIFIFTSNYLIIQSLPFPPLPFPPPFVTSSTSLSPLSTNLSPLSLSVSRSLPSSSSSSSRHSRFGPFSCFSLLPPSYILSHFFFNSPYILHNFPSPRRERTIVNQI